MEWNITLVDQSINRLYCLSQLYPRTDEQEELSEVTKKSNRMIHHKEKLLRVQLLGK